MPAMPAQRLLIVPSLLLMAAPAFALEICEPTDNPIPPSLYPHATTSVAFPSSTGGGGDGCDHGRMGIDIAEPPMPPAQLRCEELHHGPDRVMVQRCVAHPRGGHLSYQWFYGHGPVTLTVDPNDPSQVTLTCQPPSANTYFNTSLWLTVNGPLGQSSQQMLDIDCSWYEPLPEFPE